MGPQTYGLWLILQMTMTLKHKRVDFFSECMTTDHGEVGDMPASEFFTTHAEF